MSGADDAARPGTDGPGLATTLIHHGYRPPAGFAAPMPGVFKASTVMFPSVAAMRARDWRRKDGYTYGLHGTPTSFTLEERIATLEGARHGVLAPSGLAAIMLVDLAMLGAGDEVLVPANAYQPGVTLKASLLARYGVTLRRYDPMDAAALPGCITPRTKLLWAEAPGSVTMEFPDLHGILAAARAAGVATALDNTWGAGVALNGFDAGADIVMQALTKYASGGGDVLMGSVCTRDDALAERLKLAHMQLGLGVAANDVEAVLRGLPSLALRYAAQDAAARRLAGMLAQRPEIAQVLHPALPGSPGHEHWRAQARAAAGLFSVRFPARTPVAKIHAFCEALRCFRLGYSWAGPVSLVVPYDLSTLRAAADPALSPELVRFSVGLEDVADLEADLMQALAQLR